MTFQEWILNNGVGFATWITIIIYGLKASRWSGVVDANQKNTDVWQKSHIENHPGPSN